MNFLAEIEPRLSAAFALRLLVGAVPIPSDETALLSVTAALARAFRADAMTARLAADPPFPGSTVGIERIGESARLVCACRVSSNGVPLGVAFTVLVVGRAAQVTLAPLSVSIEPTWQALGEK